MSKRSYVPRKWNSTGSNNKVTKRQAGKWMRKESKSSSPVDDSYNDAIRQIQDIKVVPFGEGRMEGREYILACSEKYMRCIEQSVYDETFISNTFNFVITKLNEYKWVGHNKYYEYYDDDIKRVIGALITWHNKTCSIILLLTIGEYEVVGAVDSSGQVDIAICDDVDEQVQRWAEMQAEIARGK